MKIKALFFLISAFVAVAFTLPAPPAPPTVTLTGKIQDETGIGIPNAKIRHSSGSAASSDAQGNYTLAMPSWKGKLTISATGFLTKTVSVGTSPQLNVVLVRKKTSQADSTKAVADEEKLQEVVIQGRANGIAIKRGYERQVAPAKSVNGNGYIMAEERELPEHNTNEFKGIEENTYKEATRQPLSTFSIDVDKASYSLLRQYIDYGQLPPVNAVRVEELINYFTYDYAGPNHADPVRIHTEIAPAPWNKQHRLLAIGLQAREVATEKLPPSNLVFLVDVSGSMDAPNKLPLVQSSLRMLVEKLRPTDHVSLVVYAGAAGVVLEPTSGDEKRAILAAIDNLRAGGSTAGGEGLRLAYSLAAKHFRSEGNNRVILATDGDFNIGESSDAAMEMLITEKRKSGVFLTVLGYGMGNYKDSKLETLADKGNGNYGYIDNLQEARKTLVNEFGGTLFTLAKDVKIQVEFNPAMVHSYRLIGYENRKLNDEDFNNDRKDAGEMGSGHTVTALYEIVPVDQSSASAIDPLKYQSTPVVRQGMEEWATVKVRYKEPAGEVSRLISAVVPIKNNSEPGNNWRWASAVAAFGMKVRNSEYMRDYPLDAIIAQAVSAKGTDLEGYRAEFINLMRNYREIPASNH